jgi:hypothetical protein
MLDNVSFIFYKGLVPPDNFTNYKYTQLTGVKLYNKDELILLSWIKRSITLNAKRFA